MRILTSKLFITNTNCSKLFDFFKQKHIQVMMNFVFTCIMIITICTRTTQNWPHCYTNLRLRYQAEVTFFAEG